MSFARWRHLFSTVDLTKLCHNVHNEVTLICAKFGADLMTISKDTEHKTKWPRFFWPTRYITTLQLLLLTYLLTYLHVEQQLTVLNYPLCC